MTQITTVKHFTADRHCQLNSRLPQLFRWSGVSLREATQLLRENYNSNRNYRVPIQHSEGRQVFSSQTTILRNIISPVKLLKGKKPEFSWFALPVCSSFQAVSKAKPNSSSVSVGIDSLCPNPNPPTEEASQDSLHQT